MPTRGSGENVPLLEAGTIDIGLVFARLDLDEAIAYDLAAALHKAEHFDNMFGSQIGEGMAQNTLKALPRRDAPPRKEDRRIFFPALAPRTELPCDRCYSTARFIAREVGRHLQSAYAEPRQPVRALRLFLAATGGGRPERSPGRPRAPGIGAGLEPHS